MEPKRPKYIDGIGWRYDTEHTMTRRMSEHDYQSRSIYMITMNVTDRKPLLGSVQWQATDGNDAHIETTPLFTPGYQDSVLKGRNQLEHMFRYIEDNPRRYAIKRMNPDLFRVVCNLTVADMTFATIGNRWLLDKPQRLQVRCHNNTKPENLRLIKLQKEYFLERGRKGGVIVSPCISPGEKEIARAALDAGVPLVVILENGFPPMYKPPGRYFEACAKGQLLMLAPWPYHMGRKTISRVQCMALNDMTRNLSTEPWTTELETKMKSTLAR